MTFREWLSGPNQQLASIIQAIKARTRIMVRDGIVHVQFLHQMSVLQVAHTVYEGLESEDPHGKGGLAYRVIAPDVKWNPQEVEKFKSGLQKRIQYVGKEMGLLFEVEVFLYLIEVKYLEPVGEKENFWAYARKSAVESNIIEYVGEDLAKQISQMVEIHARDIGEKIYRMADKRCQKMQVEFLGGESKMATDTTDLRVGCLNYSLKFTSETRVHMLSLSHKRTYKLLGGKDVDEFMSEVERRSAGFKSLKQYVVGEFSTVAERFTDPQRFTKLLNFLIGGGGKVMPAVSLYIRHKGSVGYSSALMKDFVIGQDGYKLLPRKGAVVTLNATDSYVKLTYRVAGGTPYGTFIQLEPQVEGVNIKINNIASR